MRATLAAVVLLAGCQASASQPDAGPGDPDEPDAAIDAPVTRIDAPPPEPDAPPVTYRFKCSEPPPAGAALPPPPPAYSGGTCPTLVPGLNSITSSGKTRDFILVTPTTPLATGERLPLLFMWHWLGGSANGFLERGEIQAAADEQHFVGVIPVALEAKIFGTDFDTRWPFDITQSPARMDEEYTFFDDMLACVSAQQPVNQSCVSSIGVSAGALFTDQLAQARSQYLASFVSLSGGTGASLIKPWDGAARKLPAVVLWGGDGPPGMDGVKDILGCAGIGMDFSVASRALEDGLVADGHFFIECKHNCGHVEPPLEAMPGSTPFSGMWSFVLDHPYWLPAGTSPYQDPARVTGLPAWCAIGANGATPRSGDGCPAGENPCVN